MSTAIESKLARIRAGGRPRVLDLFAGCGGLSLGFHAAGFEIVAAVENDPDAARSHGENFHAGAAAHSKARDICSPPEELAAQLNLGPVAEAFDVIVGGPPCQAFARVGRPKLREIDDHPKAFIHDPRARLYLQWLNYVEACQPLAVLMENVPDVLNHGGQNIAEETCEVLERKGYAAGYTLLNAAYYGVPQMRERMFLIGCRREIVNRVTFPSPTHWVDLPSGYEGTRAVALKLVGNGRSHKANARGHFISDADPGLGIRYRRADVATEDLLPAITARKAIGDLPPIDARQQLDSGELRRGARRFDTPIAWDHRRKVSEFARRMKTWSGFEAPDNLLDHVIRYLPRDYKIFARMNTGDQYPQASEHAREMFEEFRAEQSKAGHDIHEGTREYIRHYREFVPPYDVNKFPNKWRKMWPDAPARTLMAHLGKDSYSHIHYDSQQARTISVREAARLQSFPDGFKFCGTMNPAFRQIGNAVPPLMAKAVAETMTRVLKTPEMETKDVHIGSATTICDRD